MADHHCAKPQPWPRARTLALRADAALLRALAAAATPCAPTACAHAGAPFAATASLAAGAAAQVATLCAPCFDARRDSLEAARFAALPALAAGACALCGAAARAAAPLRDPLGCGMAVCAACYRGSCARQLAADALHQPRLDVVPDEVLPGLLYISEKDG